MRNWKSSLFSILIALTLSCLGLGTSLWNVDSNVNPNTQKSFPLASNSNDKVAYFKDSKGATRSFTTIEGALNAAGKGTETDFANTIYVIPGTNPTINTDCTVESKDTLCIPYEGETYNGRQRNAEKGGTSNNSWKTPVEYTNGKISSGDYIANGSNPFADSNADYVAYFKKNEVTLNSTLIISSGAYLQIGGILGWQNIGVTGQTSGKYCQITRGKGASIENSGTIDCRGYIKEANSTIETTILNKSGSVRKRPFVFYDYKGGSYTAAAYGGETKIFPLTRYDFPNVQSNRIFKHTSKLIGYVDLFTGTTSKEVDVKIATVTVTIAARHNTDDLEIIGPKGDKNGNGTINHLFETCDSGSSIEIKRNNRGVLYTTYDSSGHCSDVVTDVLLNGNCSFNSTSVSIAAGEDTTASVKSLFGTSFDASDLLNSVKNQLNQTIQTATVDFPLPWNFQVSIVEHGSLDICNPRKLMPGAQILVNHGATLQIKSKVVVYDNSLNSGLFIDPGSVPGTDLSTSYFYPNKGEAVLINNGARVIASGSSFGGKITSQGSDATLNIASGAHLTNVSCHEGIGKYSISGTDIKFEFYDYPNSPVTKTASGVCYRNYYRTDLAPNFVCENRNEQALVAGETYTSYPLTAGSSSFGWHDSKGSHDKYGIKFDYTNENNETIDLKENPNSDVDYFENNSSDINLSTPVPEGNWAFDGFYYDKSYSLPLKEVSNQYIIEPSKAIGYVNNNGVLLNKGILSIYTKWIRKGIKVDLEIQTFSIDHTVSTDQVQVETGSQYNVNELCGSHAPLQRLNPTTENYFRTEYSFSKWILFERQQPDKNLLSESNTFLPKENSNYVLKQIFDEHKFCYLKVNNSTWVSSKKTWYIIHNFSVQSNNTINLISSSPVPGTAFSANGGNSNTEATTFVEGWISLDASISFQITTKSWKPNYVHIKLGDEEKNRYEGNIVGGDKKVTINIKTNLFDEFGYESGKVELIANQNK